jgi:hypothetical protein
MVRTTFFDCERKCCKVVGACASVRCEVLRLHFLGSPRGGQKGDPELTVHLRDRVMHLRRAQVATVSGIVPSPSPGPPTHLIEIMKRQLDDVEG